MLNDAKVKAAKGKAAPYRLGDSGQLYLQVTPSGGRHWRMNYTYGRSAKDPTKPAQKTLSFGSYPAVTLTDARKRRDDAKAQLASGNDPAIEKKTSTTAKAAANANTLRVVAEAWFAKKKGTWVPKHAQKVWQSLDENVFPEIGDLPITSIKAPKLLAILSDVEARGAVETAHRLRQRLSAVFVYAIAAGIAEIDPAASLGKALSAKPRVKPQPSIIDGLRDQPARIDATRTMLEKCEAERCRATTKLALRLLALTAVRPGELGGARWAEFEDLDGKEPLWRIPAARMKGDEDRKAEADGDHLVPLAPQAVAILRALKTLTGDLALVFPGERHLHKPMSENTLRQLLIRAGYYQRHVPHGFRAAFSTIMNERLKAEGKGDDRAVVDLMLAHVPKDKVEGAYNRAAYMPRRREIAQEWANLLLDGFVAPHHHLGQPMRRT